MEIKTQDQKVQIHLLIKQLIQSEGWKLIKNHLKEQIRNKEDSILNDFTIERNKAQYSINDLEKIQLLAYKQFLDKPTDILDELEMIDIEQ